MRRLLAVCLLSACSFSLRDPFGHDAPSVMNVAPGAKGDLGNLDFTYVCLSPHEQTCLTAGSTSVQFPAGIAVGARFYVNDTDHHSIEASSPLLTPSLGAFRASRPGVVGLFATDSVKVLDFLHPRFVTATALDARIDPVTPAKLRLTVGETELLAAVPQAEGAALGGTIDAEWTVDETAVLGFDTASPAQFITLHALAVGTAKLNIHWNGLDRQLAFTVVAP